MEVASQGIEEGLAFSDEGVAEIVEFHGQVGDNVATALACVATWNTDMASRLAHCKEWGSERQRELQARHLERLGKGLKESLDTSAIHLDFIADLERINFHCAQVGIAVLESAGTTAG